ncbi:MAG TPA: TadE/TadG family type IV pilus assembly protein [Blastocatellia bacterium]|nr:TadE/TadG family type IV pilus assembly protein [Blastocatellia bacterium]
MKTGLPLNQERGAALVEAALTMLLFVIFIFAIFEGGRFLNIQQTLTNAAREGARLSVAPLSGTSTLATTTEVTNRVQTFLNASGLNGAAATINVVQNHTITGDPTHYTLVTVTVPYQVMTIPLFSNLQVNLRGRAMMRNETNLQ